MIHNMNPLRVNANGITNSNRIRAEVDSSCSSTMPTAYSTTKGQRENESEKPGLTAKDEVRDREETTAKHRCTEGFTNDTEA